MTGTRSVHAATLLLAFLTTAVAYVAVKESHHSSWPALIQLVVVLCASALLLVNSRRLPAHASVTVVEAIALVGLALMPFAVELPIRLLAGQGVPYEVQLATALRNLMIGLVALSSRRHPRHLACVCSLFLVLFSSMWATNGLGVGLLIGYSAVAMWWLADDYWEKLEGRFAASSAREVPRGPLAIVVVGALGVACLTAMAASSKVTSALAGWAPTSGGTGDYDPFARGGVGDGDQLVAAQEDAMSFGPIESELFLESEMPSLYDVFNELYEEPAACKRHAQVRAIPLTPEMTKTASKQTATTKQAGREFSLVRQPAERRQGVANRESPALLTVAGRTPLHLKLETFNRWDGHSLSYDSLAEPSAALESSEDADGCKWAVLPRNFKPEDFPESERHLIRVLNLRSKRVPAPPQLTGVHVDQMPDARLFVRSNDGEVDYAGAAIPQLAVLHLNSRPARPAHANKAEIRCYPPPSDSRPLVRNVAERWTTGLEPGWPEIAAICARLHTEYRHDQAAVVPTSCDDAVEHFLISQRAGPDYLFATAAALLLRSLGYETQVACGFYAAPDKFDLASGQTPVDSDDGHFWTEVRLASGDWAAIEPTPGFQLLEANLSWQEQCLVALSKARNLCLSYRWSIAMCGAIAMGIFAVRRRLAAIILIAYWNCQLMFAGPRASVLWTVWLIERRMTLFKRGRPQEMTTSTWLRRQTPHHDFRLTEFLALTDWAMYSDRLSSAASVDLKKRCREIVAVICYDN